MSESSRPPLSRIEFVGLLASLMAVEALAIDIMLPAFPAIGDAFAVGNANDRSLVITVFLLGFGLPQLFFGPVTDRFGRRAPILIGLGVFILACLATVSVTSFAAMLALRFVQGLAAAAMRVAIIAAVRDRYSGQAMVETMSLIFTIFLVVPIVCPGIGQLILFLGPWPLIFIFMALVGLVLGVWGYFRLPETLPRAERRPLDPAAVTGGFAQVLGHRRAFFYGIAGMFLFGVICNFLNTAQPIYVDIYGLGALFPLALAATAGVEALSQVPCSRVSRRFGMRRTAHGATAVIVFSSFLFTLGTLSATPPLWVYMAMLMFTLPPMVAAFMTTGALGMEPLGEVAGTASSVFGATTMVGGALFGLVTAQLFDGTVTLVLAANAAMGLGAFLCCVVAEKGRLFRRDPAVVPAAGLH